MAKEQDSNQQQEEENNTENMFIMMCIGDEQPRETPTVIDRLGNAVDDILQKLHLK